MIAAKAPVSGASEAVRQAHDAAVCELEEALEARQQIEDRILALEDLVSTLETITRKAIPDAPRMGIKSSSASNESRVSAIERLLEHADGPLSPQDIQELLRAEGREESRKDIASALSYLGTNDRAERLDRGVWTNYRPAR
ncbi:MAG: hypothetical protein R3343_09625 [Nitriliruptorales bacterium]|nr:hypothetical protein [Nitriliruptorales bacterium]